MQRILRAITTEHQAASWAVSAESSFTNRRDTDVATHHHRTGIEKGLDHVDFFLFSLHFCSYHTHLTNSFN